MDELASRLDNILHGVMPSTNVVYSVGWYVDSGAIRHMTFNKVFNKVQEHKGGIQVGLGNDASCLAI